MEEVLEASREVVEATCKAAKMLRVECSTIAVVDQVASGVHMALGKARNGHSGHTERVTTLLMRKDKASRWLRLRAKKEWWCTTPSFMILNGKIYFSFLKNLMLLEFRE